VKVFVVDAFADAAFRGNPAGVVLLDEPRDDTWMQAVASEMRHSETAFVLPLAERDRYDLRWFTPTVEVDLCGHATLATTHVLAGGLDRSFVFHTRSGPLSGVAHDGSIRLTLPAKPTAPRAEPAGLRAALGVTPANVEGNGMDFLVEVADADTVTRLRPDIEALRAVECRGVIVTARADPGADHDFVSRFFAPRVGVPEDPVTGSAHCALGPYWAQRLGRRELSGVQLSPRGGRVGLLVRGDEVELHGRADTVVDGELRA
jgi:PhzF family phenazine biosynthesis protein